MKGKYLITTDAWFYGPDGLQYKSAWGEVVSMNDQDALGIKTNSRSANWFVKIGSEDNHLIIAGCQIHYAIKCESKPAQGMVEDYSVEAGVRKDYKKPIHIYIAE